MSIFKQNKISAVIGRGIITTAVLAAALALQAQQGNVDKPKSDTAAQDPARAGDAATCLKEAAKMNLTTIKFAQLAAQKAESEELKRFSQTLESDHKRAQTQLEPIAKKYNVTFPTTLDAKCEEEIAKLQALSGREFDKEFAKSAVEGHAMALAHLQKASKEAKDADVAQYTRDLLARVKDHQQRAREVAKTVGVDQATITTLESKAQEPRPQ
jgi:putative membrane protein